MPDPTTQSNYLQVYTTNVEFSWTLDFEEQILEGSATHTLLAREAGVEEVVYMLPILLSLGRIDDVLSEALTLPI